MSEENNMEQKKQNTKPTTRNVGPPAQWFAFYTAPRAEKKVHKRLQEAGFESYLPLIKTLQQWSDRKKMVEKVLISSYIFVRVPEYQIREVVAIDGVSAYVRFEGKPAAIPDYQIDNLRILVNSDEKIEISGEKFVVGDDVEVTHGSFRGIRGQLVKIRNNNKVLVRIDKLDLNIVVTIQKAFLKKLR